MSDQTERPSVMGIDPGLDGAVAVILPAGAEAHVTPTIAAAGGGKRRLDAAGMLVLLERHPIALAVIEAVGPMPKQGVVSTFRFGVGFGTWLGMLAALRIPHLAVTPHAWKKAILAGTTKDKGAAIQGTEAFPGGLAAGDGAVEGAARRPGRRAGDGRVRPPTPGRRPSRRARRGRKAKQERRNGVRSNQ